MVAKPDPGCLDHVPLGPGVGAGAPDPEVWRPVSAFPGWEVSDQGRVRSSRRWPLLILRPARDRKGYLHLSYWVEGRQIGVTVHRLVLDAFIGPCPPGHEASHLNGDPADNRLSNLTWESRPENNRRKHEHGTAPVGEANPAAKFTAEQVRAIREVGRALPQRLLARVCGTTQPVISNILGGKSWSHLDE